MVSFDAPTREVCSVMRIRTNTPLQALVLLNDPVYVEAAEAWAQNIMEQYPNNIEKGIAESLQLITRSEEHTSELQSLMRISYAVFCLKKKTINIEKDHSTYRYIQ